MCPQTSVFYPRFSWVLAVSTAALNAGWSSQEKAVCLSVCLSACASVRLSVKRVACDKTEERSVQIFIPYER